MTIVMVTHERTLAEKLADRLAVMVVWQTSVHLAGERGSRNE